MLSLTQKLFVLILMIKKLNTAKEMGADFVVNSKESDAPEKLCLFVMARVLTVLLILLTLHQLLNLILLFKKKREFGSVGLFGGSIELSLVTIPLKSITIQGAYTGNYDDMVELLALARKGTLNPVISKRYNLDECNTALEDLKARKILGRAVIKSLI